MRAQPEQQAPPVQRIRLRYAKRGRLRFTSHRDFSRAFERAVQRAGVPMAYSSGFHPHPRISYAGAAPTGSASEAEYVELGLAREVDPEAVRRAIDDALPDGLDVLAAAVSPGGSLADRLEVSLWHLRVRGVEPAALEAAVAAFLAAESVEVQRMTKKGLRTFDCRAAVVRLGPVPREADAGREEERGEGTDVEVLLRHTTPAVRPDDVLTGLRQVAGLSDGVTALYRRMAQGRLAEETGEVVDPLVADG